MRLFAPMLLVVAVALQALAISMVITGTVGLSLDTGHAGDFFYSAAICAVGGMLSFSLGWMYRTEHLFKRQMFVITSGTWLLVPVFATLPLFIRSTRPPQATPSVMFARSECSTYRSSTPARSLVVKAKDDAP